jgi:hypothetical protein
MAEADAIGDPKSSRTAYLAENLSISRNQNELSAYLY